MTTALNFVPEHAVMCGKNYSTKEIYPMAVNVTGQVEVAGALVYQGTWNANTNTPTLSDATGAKGQYYVVSTGGTQNLGSGNITFSSGDWVVHNGSIFEKADHTDVVTSVNGRQGVVTGLVELEGVSGGQIIKGDTATGGDLTLMSTAHATKGKILLGTSGYDEVNNRLGIGLNTPAAKLHIDQLITDAAIPVITLDQADVSEEFIKFIGTAASAVLTNSLVNDGDVTTATLQGWAKVYIDDIGNQLTDQAYYMPLYTLV